MEPVLDGLEEAALGDAVGGELAAGAGCGVGAYPDHVLRDEFQEARIDFAKHSPR